MHVAQVGKLYLNSVDLFQGMGNWSYCLVIIFGPWHLMLTMKYTTLQPGARDRFWKCQERGLWNLWQAILTPAVPQGAYHEYAQGEEPSLSLLREGILRAGLLEKTRENSHRRKVSWNIVYLVWSVEKCLDAPEFLHQRFFPLLNRQFKCRFCQKGFHMKTNRENHEMTHTG